MSNTLELAQALISRESITPNDAGCQQLIADRLSAIGFNCEHMRFDDTDNLWARYGDAEPVLAFIGHTDVVPPGPIEEWSSNPFEPTIHNNKLYGRGAADMKSAVAAMIVAVEQYLANSKPNGSIALLITSDEEGTAINGTQKVIAELEKRSEKITYCLVGEASSENIFGDTLKIGRRGSLSGKLRILGKQGHIAYPDKSLNPIHKAMPALAELTQVTWDAGNDAFPPTSFQISNIHAGTGANNVIPGELNIDFNFRYCTESTAEDLQKRVEAVLDKHELNYDLAWHLSGLPFLTTGSTLLNAIADAVKTVTDIIPTPSTAGGTSDGRFVAPTGAEVVEFGPINASIHKIDEHIDLDDLESLTQVYEIILNSVLN